MDKINHWYLHVDLDAFFASVEQLDNPDYRGKPVIVGGKPEDRRSVVSTASYEARAFGVHSAMPTFQAYKLCPQGIFVHGRMHRYAELSHQIMNIFRDYSPDVDQMSIDEAFIDLTGTEKLFGPPQETARAIKARVKEETGLTVSIGLATTKYLAKISSGLSKPDGFYMVKAGDEETFMLNLPLNKVWGLGPKSLELIRSKGFKTTRDIYERDYDTLEFLFGKNMASFLFNVVRGVEKESFSRERKSHSISAETTFPYDLTDIYTIETELLELAQGVFFRLLKEESFSRTAFVKIRYEDFSTCTIQETVERNIITLDSFYEIIKRLFEKRYENGRGIRLLGLGFENIVKEEKPYQQDLFSLNNDEKKQAVEKAILNLSKKHPEIKVSKARTLKAILLVIMLGGMTGRLEAEEKSTGKAPPEEPVYLFDYDINDKNHIDFSASGLWKMDFSTGVDITFGNDTVPAASPSLPLFKQETDISALLTINRHWYFEAAFADEFTRNTFAFGYKSDDLVRHFRLANRGIGMSEGYSAEHFGYALRGGDNQAPGSFIQLSSPSDKVQTEFLIRYDMTESKSQIYYGMNRVNDLKLAAEDFVYGREFHFPEGAAPLLFEIENLYIKSPDGKSYKKLSSDLYTVVQTLSGEARLFINSEAGGGKNEDGDVPAILITLRPGLSPSAILTAAGSWTDESSFFGKIQKELGCGGKYKLEDYAGQMLTNIEGEKALVIQNSEGFSPFLCPSLYDSGTKKEADYLVIADKSEIPLSKYKALEAEEIYTRLYENYFDKNQASIRVINKEADQSVYPFAEDYPEIYFLKGQKTKIAIRARSYTPVTEISISKKAAAGTVQVYKNGNLLSGTVFNENTGIITLNTSVSDTDQLLITWQEESSDFTEGALAAGAGIKLNLLPELTADASITTRLPLNQKNDFTRSGFQKNSFTAFSTGVSFSKYGFTVKDKTAISLLNDNTSEGLLLYSWQNIWDDYQEEKESNPDTKRPAPQKENSVSFSQQDFTPYNKIAVDFSFEGNSDEVYTGPLILLFDTDTGTSLPGDQIIYLEFKKLSAAKNKAHRITIASDGSQVSFDDQAILQSDYILKINRNLKPSRLTLESQQAGQTLLVEKVTFNEAQNYANLRNYTAAEFKKDGSLVSVNNYDLVKDLLISAESDQGSGNLSKPEVFVSARGQAAITLTSIKISGDAAIENTLKSLDLSEAGHSIKTEESILPFKMISAEDTYRYRPSANEVRKENSFGLNLSPVKIPFTAKLTSSASDSYYHARQNTEITADYRQKISDGDAGLNLKSVFSQKLQPQVKEKKLPPLPSYGQSWLDISGLEFSSGKEDALFRSGLYSATLSGTIPLGESGITSKPKLTYELSDSYQINAAEESPDPLFTDKENLQLLLPFSTEKKSFTFEIARSGGGNKNIQKGGDYEKDSQELFALQNQRGWFYTSIPFYELFDQNLKDRISANSGYAAKYEGSFKRSLYNSKKDLYIPSSLTLGLTREINQKPPAADLYQVRLVVTNYSVNNFGSNSAGKHFSWFTQEELSTSLTTILKIPAREPEKFKLNIQAYGQLLLFITEKTILSEQFDFSIEGLSDWNLRDTISYSRPSNTSLVTSLVKLLAPGAPASDYAISRKDSFTAEAGKNKDIWQQKYSYNHTVGIDFLEYYNINAGVGGSLILNQKLANRINLNLSLGAKAEF